MLINFKNNQSKNLIKLNVIYGINLNFKKRTNLNYIFYWIIFQLFLFIYFYFIFNKDQLKILR
jgi:hypothetical protein